MSLLAVENLSVCFGDRHVVEGASFHLERGETLALVGESGSGKTLTALSLLQLLPPGARNDAGRILLGGQSVLDADPETLRMMRGGVAGMVFQEPMTSLNPLHRIGRQVAEAVRTHRRMPRAALRARVISLLEQAGFDDAAHRLDAFPHQLSGGQRQRAMIAMALANDPALLIADEPTTALDVTIQKQILELIDSLKERLGMSVLLITHDMGVIAGRADRVLVMYAGKVVEATETSELFRDMHHPYAQALLASIPRLEQDNKRRLYSISGLPPDLSNPPSGCRFAPRCPLSTDVCEHEEPPLDGQSEQHVFACWHPVDGPLDVSHLAEDAVTDKAQETGAAPELLTVTNLVKEFPVNDGSVLRRSTKSVKAVSDVSFGVRRGETFGLVGESGCGKTTIGRLITALESPDSGTVVLDGEDVATLDRKRLRAKRRDFQLMFQDPYASLDPRMRVGRILREPLAIQGIGTRKEQDEIIDRLLAEVGLPSEAKDRYSHEFSGGQRQRIGLARALALNPKIVVADEPVSALDVSIRSQVLNLMKRLQRTHGLTYVVISHDLAVVKYLADTIGVMYLGKLVEVGPSVAIYEHPAHPYTASLIDAIPLPSPESERAKTGTTVRGELPSALDPPSGCRFRTRCSRAEEICAAEEPVLVSFGPAHRAACHFPLVPVVAGTVTDTASQTAEG